MVNHLEHLEWDIAIGEIIMGILEKKVMNQCLYDYYKENYGELDTDKWFEQPAVNVWVFEREGKRITLKCHILTGKVEEKVDGGYN